MNSKSGLTLTIGAVSTLLAAFSFAEAADFEKTDARAIGAATVAKEVCSAAFVSGLDIESFRATNSKFWMHPDDRAAIEKVDVDRDNKTVSLYVNDVVGKAAFYGQNGCVAYGPSGEKPDIASDPMPPATLDMSRAWPVGDRLSETSTGIKPATLSLAYDAAFASDAYTNAFVVIHRGELVAERYGFDVSQTTRLPGWSIAKTLQATILGRLEKQGKVDLFSRVPVPGWNSADDARRDTTYADLLRMSAPISCGNTQSWHDHDAWPKTGYPESLYVFSGPSDTYQYAIDRPQLRQDEPRGVYSNCQPAVIGYALTQIFKDANTDLRSYARETLYDQLGMNPVIIEPDRAGNPITAGYALATARDWARLGMLYANEGMWQGKRLLSLEFMSFVRAAAPHWEKPKYGGQVWLHAHDCIFGFCDAYQFNGIEGQRVVIFPSLDLVVARFGFGAGDVPNADPEARRPAIEALNNAIRILLADISPTPDPEEVAALDTVNTFFEALGSSNRAKLNAVVTEDFRLLEDGEIWSADHLFERVTKPDREERWTLTQPRISINGQMGLIELRNTGAFTYPDGKQNHEWVESATLVKQRGKWRIKLYHSTKIDQIRIP